VRFSKRFGFGNFMRNLDNMCAALLRVPEAKDSAERRLFPCVLPGVRGGSGVDGGAKAGEPVSVQGVPDPFASPVAVDEPGFAKDLEMVGDGWLGLAEWLDEVADAHFTSGGGGQHGQHA
jgi:hypothetical protein